MVDGGSRPCWNSGPKEITIFRQDCTPELEGQRHFLPIIAITLANARLGFLGKRFQLRIMDDSDKITEVGQQLWDLHT